MPPVGRTRDRGMISSVCGTYQFFTLQTRCVDVGKTEHCVDVIGNFPNPNPFELVTKNIERPILNGTQYFGSPPQINRQLINFPVDRVPAPVDPRAHIVSPDGITINNLGWQLLSKTNISKPHVSVPTFIAEMRDIPSLVKDWGGNLLRKIAKGHLTWRWAIKPMIGDISKMMDFQRAVTDRTLMMSIMQRQRFSRRRAGLGSSKVTTTPTITGISSGQGAVIDGKRSVIVSQDIWGAVKWKLDPSVQLPKLDSVEFDRLARRLALGLTSHEALATLWEITPWSWFIDWFAGIGTIIAATNNTLKCTWAENVVMVHSKSYTEWTDITGVAPWQTLSGKFREEFERKERYIAAPTLPFAPSFQPLVEPKAWSILASLAALKRFKG